MEERIKMVLSNFKGTIRAELKSTLSKLASSQKVLKLSNSEIKCCRKILARNFIGKTLFFEEQNGKETKGIVVGETKELFYVLLDDNTVKKLVKRLHRFKCDSKLLLFPKKKQGLLDSSRISIAGRFLVGDLVERMVKVL